MKCTLKKPEECVEGAAWASDVKGFAQGLRKNGTPVYLKDLIRAVLLVQLMKNL